MPYGGNSEIIDEYTGNAKMLLKTVEPELLEKD
jgi:hypothetical protein